MILCSNVIIAFEIRTNSTELKLICNLSMKYISKSVLLQ
jgi:hypothetical protein